MPNPEDNRNNRKLFDRYQITASIYDLIDPLFPGLILFEFVNYGRGDAELAGIVEISIKDDVELAALITTAVERLAHNEVLPLSADGLAVVQSEQEPTSWRVMIATGSKTDFVLWAEVEAISPDGSFTTIRSGHLGGAVARRLQAEWDSIFNLLLERNPKLVPIQHECSTCKANWEEGEFSEQSVCVECSGFAKERPCQCAPGCDGFVIRDTAATHINQEARTFPCARSDQRGIDWTADPWAAEALARKLKVLAQD